MSTSTVKKLPLNKILLSIFVGLPIFLGIEYFRQKAPSADLQISTLPPNNFEKLLDQYVSGKIDEDTFYRLSGIYTASPTEAVSLEVQEPAYSAYVSRPAPITANGITFFFDDISSRENMYALKHMKISMPNTFVFPDNKEYKVIGYLGKGGASVVLKTEDGKALRIIVNPAQAGDLERFQIIYNDLINHNVPVVKTDFSGIPYYTIHDLLRIKKVNNKKQDLAAWNAGNWLKDPNMSSFFDFVGKLADYTYIEDLHDQNIVQLEDGTWLVADAGVSTSNNEKDRPDEPYLHFNYSKYRNLLLDLGDRRDRGIDITRDPSYNILSKNIITDNQDSKISRYMMNPPKELIPAIRKATIEARIKNARYQ